MALALEGTPVHNNVTSGTSMVTSAFTTANPAQVFIAVTSNGANGVSSITGGGLTWSVRKWQVFSGSSGIDLWSAQASGALSGVQFTINFNGTTTFATSDVFAFSGQDTTTIGDGNAAVPSSGGGAANSDPGTISTNNANDVIIAAFRMHSAANPIEGSIAGSASIKISGADYQLVEYRIVSATLSGATCTIDPVFEGANAWITDALMQAPGSPAANLDGSGLALSRP